MRRRTVLTMIAAGVATEHLALAQRKLDKMLASPESYERLYFDLPQHQLLERLTELIIPADDHSPGAREARVADFIDLMTAHSQFRHSKHGSRVWAQSSQPPERLTANHSWHAQTPNKTLS